MSNTFQLPDDLMCEVEAHASLAGAEINEVIASLVRAGLLVERADTATLDTTLAGRRLELIQKFVRGECGVELSGYEQDREVDRRKDAERASAWRD